MFMVVVILLLPILNFKQGFNIINGTFIDELIFVIWLTFFIKYLELV